MTEVAPRASRHGRHAPGGPPQAPGATGPWEAGGGAPRDGLYPSNGQQQPNGAHQGQTPYSSSQYQSNQYQADPSHSSGYQYPAGGQPNPSYQTGSYQAGSYQTGSYPDGRTGRQADRQVGRQPDATGYYQPVPADPSQPGPHGQGTATTPQSYSQQQTPYQQHSSSRAPQAYGAYAASVASPPAARQAPPASRAAARQATHPASYRSGPQGAGPGPAGERPQRSGPPGLPPGSYGSAGAGDDGEEPQRGRHATDWDSGFDRVVSWTLMGGFLPGSGLVAAGRRNLGWMIVGSWVLFGLAVGGLVVFGNPVKFVTTQVLSHPERLKYAAVMLVVLAVLWAGHLVLTNVSLRRFASLTALQSTLSWVLVVTLGAGGIGAAVAAGQSMQLSGQALIAAFGGDDSSLSNGAKKPNGAKADPWKDTPRINVLLLGSDAGKDRRSVRPDTIMVASIDTKSGETVLLSLPRNLEKVPFPAGTKQAEDYPEGFYCPERNHECLLNALWVFAEDNKARYYPQEDNPGLAATIQGVQEALGLTIDNYAMVNLRGFMQFVDAIGGTTIDVKRRIPIGGKHAADGREIGVTGYIEPGVQQLNGYQTLWYARSRSDSDDWERMTRQRCVIGAIADQADPANLVKGLPGILRAARDNIKSSIDVEDFDAWATLAQRVQKAHIRSLTFTNSVIAPGNPDFDKIRDLVQTAITEPPPVASPSPTTTASPSASTSPSPTKAGTKKPKPTPTAVDPEKASDVKAVC